MAQLSYSGESSAQTYEFTSTTTAPSELSGGTSTSSQTSDVKYIINLSIIRYWEDGTCGEDWAHVKDVYGFQMAGEAVEYAQGVIIDYAAKNLSSYSTERAYLTGDYTIHYYIDSTLQDTIMGHLDVVIPENPFNASGATEVVPRVDEFYAYSIEYAAYTPYSGDNRCYIGSMDFYDTFSSAETATVSAENFIDNNAGTDISTTTGETWYVTGNYVVYHYEHGTITDSVTGSISGVTIPNSPYDNGYFDIQPSLPETTTTTACLDSEFANTILMALEVRERRADFASVSYKIVNPLIMINLAESGLTDDQTDALMLIATSMEDMPANSSGDSSYTSSAMFFTGGYVIQVYDEFGQVYQSFNKRLLTESLFSVKQRDISILTNEAIDFYLLEAKKKKKKGKKDEDPETTTTTVAETTTTTEETNTISIGPEEDQLDILGYILEFGGHLLSVSEVPAWTKALPIGVGSALLAYKVIDTFVDYAEKSQTYCCNVYNVTYQYSVSGGSGAHIVAHKFAGTYHSGFIFNSLEEARQYGRVVPQACLPYGDNNPGGTYTFDYTIMRWDVTNIVVDRASFEINQGNNN